MSKNLELYEEIEEIKESPYFRCVWCQELLLDGGIIDMGDGSTYCNQRCRRKHCLFSAVTKIENE